MADARVVSNHLVEIAGAEGNTLTPMQVLKLVYISHGYRLGFNGVPLIPNRIEAWKFGPVIPDLYHSIKDRRDKPVLRLVTAGLEDFAEGERDFVSAIYDQYKGLDGIQLSNLTHQDGTPWQRVYRQNRANTPISDDIIQNHYASMLAG
jgi:uncharacterized phage-associated protein